MATHHSSQRPRWGYLAWGAVLLLVVVGLIVPAMIPATVSWSGRAELQIQVSVDDSETGDPIPGAKVNVFDINWEEVQSGVTNAAGEQQISVRRRTRGSSGPKGTHASISLPDWRLVATANGYLESEPVLVADQLQPNQPEGDLPWVVPVTIPMQRLAEAAPNSP